MAKQKHTTTRLLVATREKHRLAMYTASLLPVYSALIRCNYGTADVDIRNLADILTSLEPAVSHPTFVSSK